MKVELPNAGLDVGLSFVAYSILMAVFIIAHARTSHTAVIYVLLLWGIFSAVQAHWESASSSTIGGNARIQTGASSSR